ncbi:serine hydrolase domain-containing protein [Steroidobacter sp.]|uniref:serine hydrolase domain-containing protein n=1 Tax=Steroidobacter sp. TaxID=1978227 RepID=UPI001A5FF764|nr:serine hydrolase domain-containing protein [Steroidobacter sp.]MBL8268985.1 beta-lactamase family protein [Steroidobacter sp.]
MNTVSRVNRRLLAKATMLGAMLLCRSVDAISADRFDDIRNYIRAELVEQSVPSLAVAVAENGKVVWEQGFGWADREKRIAADEHTLYSLASISKPLTATGLMTLVQAGQVDLDAPANRYLGNAKLRARVGNADGATIRRVANHTSGLPEHYQFFYSDEPYTRPSMDETILRYGNLVTAPGEHYEYSNLGYGVLDYVMERASGMSYAQFMRLNVFLPLGMTHTSVDIGPGLEAFAATRYGPDGLPIPFYGFDHPGASAVYSSAHDLIRFALFHLKAHLPEQRAILSDASIEQMHQLTAGDLNDGYGVGFAIRERNGYRIVSHSGSMGGVKTKMQLFPQAKLALVVLSNSDNALTDDVAERLAAKLLRGWKPRQQGQSADAAPFAPDAALLGVWKGTLETYVKDVPVELRFLAGGNVVAQVGDQLPALVDAPHFSGGMFTGALNVRIGTPDTERYPYIVRLSLKLRDEVLNGAVIAGDVEGPRVRNALAQWLELKKQR